MSIKTKRVVKLLQEKRNRAYNNADSFKKGSPEYRSFMSEASTITEVLSLITNTRFAKEMEKLVLR